MITSVRRRRTFSELRHDGRRTRHGSVKLTFLPLNDATDPDRLKAGDHGPGPQVAFAIGRSFGTAVERNRGRRRLRCAFVEAWNADAVSTGSGLRGAFLLSGNRGLLTSPFTQLVADVGQCVRKLRSSST